MTNTARNTWTIAYRKPRANRFQRVTDWSGTWHEARVMAAQFGEANPDLQVWYTGTRESELAGPLEDCGTILVDSGRRVRVVDNGTIGGLTLDRQRYADSMQDWEDDATNMERPPHTAPEVPVMTVDVHEKDRAVGWAGDGIPVWGTREDGVWKLYAGTSDEYRAEGDTLPHAIRALCRTMGLYGVGRYSYEYRNGRDQFVTVKPLLSDVKPVDIVAEADEPTGPEADGWNWAEAATSAWLAAAESAGIAVELVSTDESELHSDEAAIVRVDGVTYALWVEHGDVIAGYGHARTVYARPR